MKKNKLFLLFILLFLLSGCTFQYDMEIYNDEVNETGTFNILKSEVIDNDPYMTIVKKSAEYFYNADVLTTNKKENKYNDDNTVDVILTNNYSTINDFMERNSTASLCYDAYNIITDDDYISVSTSDAFTCFDKFEGIDSLTIHIKSNHKLKDTNADEVDGYNYYWHINKNNASKSPIKLNLYADKYVFNYEGEFTKKAIIAGAIAFLLIIVIIILRKKARKSDDI